MQIIKFLIVNFIGFLSVSGAFFYANVRGILPDLPEEMMGQFQALFFGGTMLAWLVGGGISILFFFVGGTLRLIFLSLPILIPLAYAFYILNIYNI